MLEKLPQFPCTKSPVGTLKLHLPVRRQYVHNYTSLSMNPQAGTHRSPLYLAHTLLPTLDWPMQHAHAHYAAPFYFVMLSLAPPLLSFSPFVPRAQMQLRRVLGHLCCKLTSKNPIRNPAVKQSPAPIVSTTCIPTEG